MNPAPTAHHALPPRRLTLRTLLRTLIILPWIFSYLCIYVFLLGPYLWIAGHTFDKQRCIARRYARGIFQHFLHHCCGHRLIVDPFPFDQLGGPCIMVANHQSMLDIVMIMQLPIDARCWAKKWPFRTPLLGILLRLCGHLHVEDFNVLPDARDCLEFGTSLYVFPEGTRSRTGRISRFRDGAFLLAMKTGRPIIPIAIHGSFECFPPGQLWVWTRHLRVEPLGVLWPDQSDPKGHIHLRRESRRMIAHALNQDKVSRPDSDSIDTAAA